MSDSESIMKTVDERLIELKNSGVKTTAIESTLISEGYKTIKGEKIKPGWVASRLCHLRLHGKVSVNRKAAPTMTEIPITQSASGRVMAVIGSVEDMKEMIRGFVG